MVPLAVNFNKGQLPNGPQRETQMILREPNLPEIRGSEATESRQTGCFLDGRPQLHTMPRLSCQTRVPGPRVNKRGDPGR